MTYSLIDVAPSLFHINAKTGEIRAVGTFDREGLIVNDGAMGVVSSSNDVKVYQDPAIKFTVRAVDGGEQSHTATAQVEVRILDRNDCAPTFKPSPVYEFSVAENQRDISVGRVHAEDLDDPRKYFPLRYKLEIDDNNREARKFTINRNTGEILLHQSLDRERLNGYMTLQASI